MTFELNIQLDITYFKRNKIILVSIAPVVNELQAALWVRVVEVSVRDAICRVV